MNSNRKRILPLAALLCAVGAILVGPAHALDWRRAIAATPLQAAPAADRPILQIPVPFGMQDIAFDAHRQQLFVHYVHKVDGRELAGIARYDVRSPEAPRMLDALEENDVLGHQGLSLETAGDSVRLWGSAGQNQGRQAIRFRYRAHGAPADVEQYKVFGDEFIDANVTMPKVCLHEKLLVARGRKSSRTQIIRVFDLQKMRQSTDKDMSGAYRSQWTIDPRLFRDGFPLQGIACNEEEGTIHLVAGKSDVAGDKRVYVYDLEGHLLRTDEQVSIGIANAMSEKGSYEPEGMIYYSPGQRAQPRLVLSVVTGRGKQKVMRLWSIDHLVGR